MNSTQLNSTQLNGYNYTLSNSYFKTFLITLLSLTLIFSISCSNENPTGGNISNVAEDTYGNTNNITVISQTSSTVYSAGTIGFSVSGPSGYNVSIQSVNSGSNPLTLKPSDFKYTKSTKELTLSSSGLTKFQSSSASLTAGQGYQYTITFKFATSSDSKTLDVNINLYKAEFITKTGIEAMIKSMGTVSISSTNDTNINKKAMFDFSTSSSSTFSESEPNFKASNDKGVKAYYYTYEGTRSISLAIEKTENFKKYFSSTTLIEGKTKVDGKKLICYYTFRLKEGYALSSEVAHLTSDGLSIQLTLGTISIEQFWV